MSWTVYVHSRKEEKEDEIEWEKKGGIDTPPYGSIDPTARNIMSCQSVNQYHAQMFSSTMSLHETCGVSYEARHVWPFAAYCGRLRDVYTVYIFR